nr:MAG TPA: hypothetical protein [Caudoviricetes sp.]
MCKKSQLIRAILIAWTGGHLSNLCAPGVSFLARGGISDLGGRSDGQTIETVL